MKAYLLQKRALHSSLLIKKAYQDHDEQGEPLPPPGWEKLPQPTWDESKQEWQTQQGRGGIFSGEPASYSETKTSATWNGPLEKYNYKEDMVREKAEKARTQPIIDSIWNSIRSELSKLKSTFLVKPGKPLGSYNLPELFTSQDPDERKAGYRVRSLVNSFLVNQYDEQQLAKFKEEEGGNVTEWLTSDKTKKAHFQSNLLHPGHK